MLKINSLSISLILVLNSAFANPASKSNNLSVYTMTVEENMLLALRTWQDVVNIVKMYGTQDDVQFLVGNLRAFHLELRQSTGVQLTKNGIQIKDLPVHANAGVAKLKNVSLAYDRTKTFRENVLNFKKVWKEKNEIGSRRHEHRPGLLGLFGESAYASNGRHVGDGSAYQNARVNGDDGSGPAFFLVGGILLSLPFGACMSGFALSCPIALVLLAAGGYYGYKAIAGVKQEAKKYDIDCDETSVSFNSDGGRRKVIYGDSLREFRESGRRLQRPLTPDEKQKIESMQRKVENSPSCARFISKWESDRPEPNQPKAESIK